MMIEKMEIAFSEDACICSHSMGWVGLLLGGGYFKAYEGGNICSEERLFFIGSLELGKGLLMSSLPGFEVGISKRNHSIRGLKRSSFLIV